MVRKLIESEVALLHEVEALEMQCGELIARLRKMPDSNDPRTWSPHDTPKDQRWIEEGAMDLQKGFMEIVRGIMRPVTF